MRIAAFLVLATLAACSSGGNGGNTGAGAATDSSGADPSGSGLVMTETCAAIPRDVVQQAIGRPVQSSELVDVMADSGNGMSGSNCVFDFGEARLVQVQLNSFPTGVDAGTVLQQQRDMLSGQGDGAAEDVSGLGQRAFYIPGRSLHVQLDGSRHLTVTANRLSDVGDMKGALMTIARRVIG